MRPLPHGQHAAPITDQQKSSNPLPKAVATQATAFFCLFFREKRNGSRNTLLRQNLTTHRLARFGPVTTSFLEGAQIGPDNWTYFSNNDNPGTEQPSFWVQLNLTETTATPIQYVYDPANLFGDITPMALN